MFTTELLVVFFFFCPEINLTKWSSGFMFIIIQKLIAFFILHEVRHVKKFSFSIFAGVLGKSIKKKKRGREKSIKC